MAARKSKNVRQMVKESLGDTGGVIWADLDKREMGREVSDIIKGLKTEQVARRDRYIRNLERFERRKMNGFGSDAYFGTEVEEDLDRRGLIRSAVATAVAEIYAPQKPKPQFQTLGASWETRRRAYRLDRICEGILNSRVGRHLNVWAFMVDDVATEIALQGVAPIKITTNKAEKRIEHRLIPAPNIFFDTAEGRHPRSLFHIEPIDVYQAAKLYKLDMRTLSAAKEWDWDTKGYRTVRKRVSRQVEACWAYMLPDGPEDPGVWCLTIGEQVAKMGQWDAPDFPYVFPMWEPHRDSPWASGIADEGGQRAREISDLDLRLQVRVRLAAKKRVYYKEDSVQSADLQLNDAEVHVPYTGDVPPTESLVPPFHEVEKSFADDDVRGWWDMIGLSQVSAAARREANVQSGVALMTLNDLKSGRQLAKGKRFEDCFPLMAQQYVWRLRELAKDDPALLLKLPGRRLIAEVKWSDADIDDESFTVTIGAASAMPHDPAGRQQWIATMYESGLLSPETAKFMIGNPDPDAALDADKAEEDYIEDLIATYQTAEAETWGPGDYDSPEGMIRNKPRALEKFAAAWFRIRIDMRGLSVEDKGKAEFNLQLVMRYIKELDALIKREQVFAAQLQGNMQAPQGAPAQGAPPQGAPPQAAA